MSMLLQPKITACLIEETWGGFRYSYTCSIIKHKSINMARHQTKHFMKIIPKGIAPHTGQNVRHRVCTIKIIEPKHRQGQDRSKKDVSSMYLCPLFQTCLFQGLFPSQIFLSLAHV